MPKQPLHIPHIATNYAHTGGKHNATPHTVCRHPRHLLSAPSRATAHHSTRPRLLPRKPLHSLLYKEHGLQAQTKQYGSKTLHSLLYSNLDRNRFDLSQKREAFHSLLYNNPLAKQT